MRRLGAWLYGMVLGALVGAALIALVSPFSGTEFRQRLRDHVQQARAAGRQAAEAKRRELERELERLPK